MMGHMMEIPNDLTIISHHYAIRNNGGMRLRPLLPMIDIEELRKTYLKSRQTMGTF